MPGHNHCPHDMAYALYRRRSGPEGRGYSRDALRCVDCGALLEDDGRTLHPRRTDLAGRT